MKKLILSAALGLSALMTGCVSTGGYNDLAQRVENEQDLNQQLKTELVRYQTNVKDLQGANAELAAELKKKPGQITVIKEVPVQAKIDTSALDAELDALRKELEGGLSNDFAFLKADHAVGVRLDDGASVLFNSGSWDLTGSAKSSLKALAEIVKDSLNRNPNHIVRVDGHTDSDPVRTLKSKGIETNTVLAFRRANAVRDYLVEQGIPAKKLSVLACGEYMPISNQKKLNRRVELWVSTPEGFSLNGAQGASGTVSR